LVSRILFLGRRAVYVWQVVARAAIVRSVVEEAMSVDVFIGVI
jgi:hypothetical protein